MRKFTSALMLMLALLIPAQAVAVGEPYTQQRMDALRNDGKPTLVFIHAAWCPTCRAQEKVLNELLPAPEFKRITTLRVDFDTQKPVVQAFGVRYQSTLIVFKGGAEVGRVTAETNQDNIAALLRTAL